MKKALAILLCAAMAAAAGCGAQSEQTQTPSAGNSAENAEVIETEAAESESEQQKYIDALPEADYGGHVFTIIDHTPVANGTISLYAENENGDLLNDFIFRRDLSVSELYNIEIREYMVDDVTSQVKKTVAAGDDTYDMISDWIKLVLETAGKGYYLNLYNIPTINLDNPWWDANCRDLLTISGRLFAAFSDMNVQTLDLLGGICINNTLAANLGYGAVSDKVFEGTWTFDAMREMIIAGSADLNGDSVMDQNDQFGYIAGIGDINPMIVCSERNYIINTDGEMKLNYGSEKVIAAAEKMDPIINNKQTTVYLNESPWGNEVFTSGRALMQGVTIGTFYHTYRGLELDISLLPTPKYDEQQQNYHSMMSNCSMGISIPASSSDTERTGNIIEALGAYSYKEIDEVYYDTTLQVKLARDDATKRILEIIVKGKIADLCVLNENAWGNVLTSFLNTFHKSGAAELASLAEKNAEKFQKIADKIVEEYEGLD